MKRTRKITSIVLAALMVLSTLVVSVSSVSAATTSGSEVYFDNSKFGWQDVYVYAYGTKENAKWPGELMTKEDSGLYKSSFSSAYKSEKVIFNNGLEKGEGKEQYPTGAGLSLKTGECKLLTADLNWVDYGKPDDHGYGFCYTASGTGFSTDSMQRLSTDLFINAYGDSDSPDTEDDTDIVSASKNVFTDTGCTIKAPMQTIYANGSKVTVNSEYKAGENIYVVKTNNSNGAVVAPTAIGTEANNVQVYTATSTGDAISEATIKANLTGSPNGITLTAVDPVASLVADGKVPAADATNYDFGSNGAVKFTPGAAGKYVYVFTRTKHVAPTYAAVGDGTFNGGTTYYFKTSEDVYYPAAGISAENFATYKANLYTQTAAGTPGEYDIKIINVVAGS